MKRIIDWVISPDGRFGDNPIKGRDEFLLNTLQAAVNSLSKKYGSNTDSWVYGQISFKHIMLTHQLSNVIKPEIAKTLNVGPLPRGGSSFTVNNTGSYNNQYSGASFRIFVDTEDWDRTLAMNNPGQSGNPDSPHYKNLFEEWASDNSAAIGLDNIKLLVMGHTHTMAILPWRSSSLLVECGCLCRTQSYMTGA